MISARIPLVPTGTDVSLIRTIAVEVEVEAGGLVKGGAGVAVAEVAVISGGAGVAVAEVWGRVTVGTLATPEQVCV